MCVLQQVSNSKRSEDAYTDILPRIRRRWHTPDLPGSRKSTSPGAGQAPAVSPQGPSPVKEQLPQQQVRSADGAPIPMAESLMPPPGAAAGSADLLVPLDTAPSPSTLAWTLHLLCSWKSMVGPWVVILVQEVTNSQRSPVRESPFSSLVSTNSACVSFETTECSGSIWTWPS